MKKLFTIFFFVFSFLVNQANAQVVKLTPNAAKERVDVEIDGKLFTSYRWEERIKRPVLFPVKTADGAFITRGFPMETRRGETIDHPHQVGLSFS